MPEELKKLEIQDPKLNADLILDIELLINIKCRLLQTHIKNINSNKSNMVK